MKYREKYTRNKSTMIMSGSLTALTRRSALSCSRLIFSTKKGNVPRDDSYEVRETMASIKFGEPVPRISYYWRHNYTTTRHVYARAHVHTTIIKNTSGIQTWNSPQTRRIKNLTKVFRYTVCLTRTHIHNM